MLCTFEHSNKRITKKQQRCRKNKFKLLTIRLNRHFNKYNQNKHNRQTKDDNSIIVVILLCSTVVIKQK